MATLERLVVELATDASDYNKGLAQTSKKTSSWGGKLAGIAGKAALGAVAAAGAAIVGVGAAGVKEFVGFQNSMNEVFTLLPGLSKKAMGSMQGDVKKFAKEFGVLPKETVPALYQAISAGVPKENVFQFLETAQKAARGGVTDLETAVQGISSTVNAYGKDTINAAQASDLMFTALKLGGTTFEELSKSLFQVNPTAAALGVKFGDVTAAMAAMTAQGTPTSVATTQLRQLFVELSKEGGKTSDVFKEIAGKTFKQFVAEGGNTQDALQLLEQHAATAGVGINDLFGSVEAGGAALQLTGRGTAAFGSALKEMGTASGATEAAFKTMEGGIKPSMDKLGAAWNVMLLDVGEKIAPAFAGLAEMAGAALPAIGAMFVWIADKAAVGVQWITDNWPKISETVMGVFNAVKGVIESVLSPALDNARGSFAWVKDWIDENLPLMRKTVETVLGAITRFWDENGANIMRIVQGFMSIVTTIFGTALRNVFDMVKVVMQLITGDFQGAGETLKGIATRMWQAIVGIFGQYINMAKALITGFNWASLGRSIIRGITAGIRNASYMLMNAVRSVGASAIQGIQNLLGIGSPSKVMAKKVGAPMAEGIGVGFRRAIKRERFDISREMIAGLEGARAITRGRFDISREMIAGLEEARTITAHVASNTVTNLAALRSGVGTQIKYNPSASSLYTLSMRHMADGRGLARSNNGGQTNYFTFNITAGNAAEAETGVLGALRQSGVTFR